MRLVGKVKTVMNLYVSQNVSPDNAIMITNVFVIQAGPEIFATVIVTITELVKKMVNVPAFSTGQVSIAKVVQKAGKEMIVKYLFAIQSVRNMENVNYILVQSNMNVTAKKGGAVRLVTNRIVVPVIIMAIVKNQTFVFVKRAGRV